MVLLVPVQQQKAEQLANLSAIKLGQRSIIDAHPEAAEKEELAPLSSKRRCPL
jgi:hypothetical protein